MTYQPTLLNHISNKPAAPTHEIRVFGNDEIVTSLKFLQMAGNFDSFSSFKSYLEKNLPYNSLDTRHRRANYILNRYYPEKNLNTPLTLFTHHNQSMESLKAVVFYHLTIAEPLLAKVADDLIYPALPLGRVERGRIKEYILASHPSLKPASQEKVLHSIFNAYNLLLLNQTDSNAIKFQLHPGSLESFIYILASEFTEPGIYSFESLFASPAHRWLLWDREWIRKQLYALRDIQIVSKVSEIDNIRQFSLEFGQRETLERFFKVTGQENPLDQNVGEKKS
jgi:DNA repair protein RadC